MPTPRLELTDPAFPHGTTKGYDWGCKKKLFDCPGNDAGVTCPNAIAAYEADRKARKATQTASGVEAATAIATQPAPDASPDETPAAADAPSATSNEPSVDTEGDKPDTIAPEPDTAPSPRPPTNQSQIAALGASRRLQALVAIGYTPVRLAHMTKISVDGIWWLIIDPPEKISDVANRIISREFSSHSIQPIEESQKHDLGREAGLARNLALTLGFVGPFTWENIDHDPAPIKKNHRGRVTLAEIPEDLRNQIREPLRARIDELLVQIASAEASPAPAPNGDVPAGETATSAEAHATVEERILNDIRTAAALEEELAMLRGVREQLVLAEQAGREIQTEVRRLAAENQQLAERHIADEEEAERLAGINTSLANQIHLLEHEIESKAAVVEALQLAALRNALASDPEAPVDGVSVTTGGAADARTVTITIQVGA